MVWSATYAAFGAAMVDAESTVTNNLRFPGQYFDAETGGHWNFQRYFDPVSGRYTQVDPIGFAGGDVNLFRYVGNGVVVWSDPWGLWQADRLRDSLIKGGDTVRDYLVPRGDVLRSQLSEHVNVDVNGIKVLTAKTLYIYCNGGSSVISACADLGTIIGTITIQPEVALFANATAAINFTVNASLCAEDLKQIMHSYSTYTTVIGVFMPPGVLPVISSTIDIPLTLLDYDLSLKK